MKPPFCCLTQNLTESFCQPSDSAAFDFWQFAAFCPFCDNFPTFANLPARAPDCHTSTFYTRSKYLCPQNLERLSRSWELYELVDVTVTTLPEEYEGRLSEMASGQFERLLVPDPYDYILSKLQRARLKRIPTTPCFCLTKERNS
jgi:hypothetical protein